MAGNLSPECGRGRWGDSSLLGRRLSEDSSRQQLLEKWESVWSSAGEVSAEKAPREEESPLVFLCSRCRRPLGDSLSWVTCLEDTNCILLRSVSSNVSVDKEQKLSKRKDEDGCYVLGSSEKRIVPDDRELLNLESRVEIEKSLQQMEEVLKALQTKLWEVESKFSLPSSKS
ncbi:protein Mis18-alpha isoform X2 [Ochotona curzoniae]|uniref:protein Mis18-alpha isoform X2 n=1 Tax=Ochotona curzoniae TaxID=130825 RepID=UPI001B34FC42|nr:protein Mis18-alpha isoform X2 [Ochotona curzoniae]